MINRKDVEFYRENGYLLVENVFDTATLAKIRKTIAELVAKAAGLKTHSDIYDLEGIDKLIPVDVYISGCPPRPEALIEGLMKLQRKVGEESSTQEQKATFFEEMA